MVKIAKIEKRWRNRMEEVIKLAHCFFEYNVILKK